MKHFIKNSFFIIVILISLIGSGMKITPAYAQVQQGDMKIVPLFLPDGWQYGYLNGIWGSSANDVYAVGHGYDGNTVLPLLYRNNGTSWTRSTVNLPNQWSAVVFTSIWGAAANSVFIAGYGYSGGSVRPVLYRGNGSTWSIDMPVLPAGWTNRTIYGVWGSGATNVYVVGSGFNTNTGAYQPFMYRWNGSALTEVTLPALPGGLTTAHLYGIWGTGASDIYAVGSGRIGISSIDQPLLYRWNGTAWAASVPLPSGLTSGNLKGIWGSAATNIYAVGSRTSGSANVPLLQRWNGSIWETVGLPSLPNGVDSAYLSGIWGFSSSDIYVVGYGEKGNTNTYLPLLYHYNGTDWTDASPSMPIGWESDSLYGIWGSSATDLYAIGHGNNGSFDVPLLYHSDQAGADVTAPGSVTDLAAESANGVTLTWTAPPDDAGNDNSGPVASYLVKYSTDPITSWAQGTPITTGVPAPGAPGTTQTMRISGLNPDTLYHFAIRAQDEQFNLSETFDTASATPSGWGAGTFDDTHAGWTYSGSWNTWSGSGPYNNTMHYTNATGASASFTFQAPARFILLFQAAANRSNILVSVDGGAPVLVNAYSATSQWQKSYTSELYSDTDSHTVTVSTPGDGKYIDVDAIQIVAPPAPQGIGTYDDTHAAWTYSGNWATWSGSGPYNNTMHYTNATGASASFTFQAPARFILFFQAATNRSNILVSVDGGAPVAVNAYSATSQWQKSYISEMYSDTDTHTVTISTPGTGKYIDVDAIQIAEPPAPQGIGTYDDTHAGWTYSGSWNTWSGIGPQGNTMHYTNATGASASFIFQAPARFILFFQAAANRSNILVSVDGGAPVLVDAYSATSQWQKSYISEMYSDTDSHTVTISTPGDGKYIDVDAIQIAGPPGPQGIGTYDDTHFGWTYSGNWATWSGSGPYNNTMHYTNATGASASFTFQAPARFILYFQAYSNRSNILVSVDGGTPVLVDAYNSGNVWQQTYTSELYSDTDSHTVTISTPGDGKYIDVDAIEIQP